MCSLCDVHTPDFITSSSSVPCHILMMGGGWWESQLTCTDTAAESDTETDRQRSDQLSDQPGFRLHWQLTTTAAWWLWHSCRLQPSLVSCFFVSCVFVCKLIAHLCSWSRTSMQIQIFKYSQLCSTSWLYFTSSSTFYLLWGFLEQFICNLYFKTVKS